MTAQIPDRFKYLEEEYSIVARENEWQFEPKRYGLTPFATSTANYRGYYCEYKVEEGYLVLDSLYIGLKEDNIPLFQGIKAQKGKYYKVNHLFEYKNVGLEINYSGGIIIGKEFLREFYVHMGFQRAHCYKCVKELIFNKGEIIKVIDYSDKMKEIREKIESNNIKEKNIHQFIEDSFSLSYDKKWGF